MTIKTAKPPVLQAEIWLHREIDGDEKRPTSELGVSAINALLLEDWRKYQRDTDPNKTRPKATIQLEISLGKKDGLQLDIWTDIFTEQGPGDVLVVIEQARDLINDFLKEQKA